MQGKESPRRREAELPVIKIVSNPVRSLLCPGNQICQQLSLLFSQAKKFPAAG
jgi:hypothetical protein